MNKSRLFYLDNLKILLILIVIMHHVGQGYGPSDMAHQEVGGFT